MRWIVYLLACSLTAGAWAQSPERLDDLASSPAAAPPVKDDDGAVVGERVVGKATPSCSGGLIYDDNSFENGYQPALTASDGGFVMRFDPPANSVDLEQVCLCFTQLGNTDTTLLHDIVVYDDNGGGGAPGTELFRVGAITGGIPEFGSVAVFSYDLTGFNVPLNGGSFYLGVQGWDRSIEGSIFLCADENGPGGQPAYSTNTGTGWAQIGTATNGPNYRALGVRTDVIQGGGGGCVPGPTTLCIDNQPGDARFKVTVQYATALGGGQAGTATAQPLTGLGITKGGIMAFLNPANPEILVKVLNGCNSSGFFWVFYAATTTFGFNLTVEDTIAGGSVTYTNPDQNPAATVTDIRALNTCP